MNIENMEKLLERLKSERNPVAFNMLDWFQHNGSPILDREEIVRVVETHACGTVACLAGQAAVLAFEERFADHGSIENTAAAWLGLDLMEKHDLFNGWWEGWHDMVDGGDEDPDLSRLTLDMAITEVARLITEARRSGP